MKDPDMLSQVVYAFADVAVINARSQGKQKSLQCALSAAAGNADAVVQKGYCEAEVSGYQE